MVLVGMEAPDASAASLRADRRMVSLMLLGTTTVGERALGLKGLEKTTGAATEELGGFNTAGKAAPPFATGAKTEEDAGAPAPEPAGTAAMVGLGFSVLTKAKGC